jgi:hypothetical protein
MALLLTAALVISASGTTVDQAVAMLNVPLTCFGGISQPFTGPTSIHYEQCGNLMFDYVRDDLSTGLYTNIVMSGIAGNQNDWHSCDINHGPYCTQQVDPPSTSTPCIGTNYTCPGGVAFAEASFAPGIDADVTGFSVTHSVSLGPPNVTAWIGPVTFGGGYHVGFHITVTGTNLILQQQVEAQGTILTPSLSDPYITSIPVNTTAINALIKINTAAGPIWALADYGAVGTAQSNTFSVALPSATQLTGEYNVSMILVDRAVLGGGNRTWKQVYGGRQWSSAIVNETGTLYFVQRGTVYTITNITTIGDQSTYVVDAIDNIANITYVNGQTTTFVSTYWVTTDPNNLTAGLAYTLTSEIVGPCTNDSDACTTDSYILVSTSSSSGTIMCHAPIVGCVIQCYQNSDCVRTNYTGVCTYDTCVYTRSVCTSSDQCIRTDYTGVCTDGVCIYTIAACVLSSDCQMPGHVGTCIDEICDYVPGVDCTYSYITWYEHATATAAAVNPRLLPIVLGGGIATISTAAELIVALRGWGLTTPIRSLAAILAVCKLNQARGAIPPTGTLVAIAAADEIVGSCFEITAEQWKDVLKGGATCGGYNVVQIADSMITMLTFIEGQTTAPSCKIVIETFPVGG